MLEEMQPESHSETNVQPRRRRYPPGTIVGAPKPPQARQPTSAEAEIVEAYAEADELAKKAAAMREQARKKLLDFLGNTGRQVVQSPRHVLSLRLQERRSLDTERIKREMPADWLSERSNVTTVQTISITNLGG